MNKIELEKNRLDLAYHRKAQMLNAVIIFGTVGFLSLLGSFVWYPERWFIGAVFSAAILFIAVSWYKKIDSDLKAISEQVQKIGQKTNK